MDPFTEKLLERTRARRENLQKKLSERPMAKRLREPLGETNSVTSQSAADTVPQVSTKPSPSKRKCSGENLQPAAGEQNQEPATVRPMCPPLANPPTDKKPPSGSRPSSSSSSAWAAVQSEPEKVTPSCSAAPSREVHEEEPTPSAVGMKSRLQRLAEQRRCWDGDASAEADGDCPPLSMLGRPADVRAAVAPATSTEAPAGRRGRLAHLAATIGSWEDDLSHANLPKESPKPKQTPFHPPAGSAQIAASSCSPLKTPTSLHPSAASTQSSASSSSPLKTPASLHPPAASTQSSASSSIPLKAPASSAPSSSTAVTRSPLKSQTPSSGPNTICSPQKPKVGSQPAPEEKPPAGAPGVKSFLERFEERCQARVQYSPQTRTPAGGAPQIRTLTGTPNTRLVQERLRVAQNTNTSSADLTQRQKLERESELSLIRNRFQKGNNMWKNNDQQPQSETSTDLELGLSESSRSAEEHCNRPAEGEGASCVSQDEPKTQTPPKTTTGPALASPPVSTSSPLRTAGSSETNVQDQTINSAVISQLFEGMLDQTEKEEEEEEEDALNISSMSLLTPLAETVAAVAKSPERGMMTSTPANSFLVKSTPDHMPRLGKVQKTSMSHSSSSDSEDTHEDELRLPYSIDAYRSTRVKETERPSVHQVIVRREDVTQKAGEPRGASLLNVKQKMKILTNEISLQQTVIHQASQALNCCTDEEHGKGSQVEAEAERLLLVATERREALKSELDRLRGKPAAVPGPPATSASRGSISLRDLRLPLKADFVCSASTRPESSKHSFFILIRAGAEHTVATSLASTHCGLNGDMLTFNTTFTLSDASSDFEIDIEVYCLVQKREMCIDKKKKSNKSKAITPKRFLAISRAAQTPVVASPGGPHAVRTSNFVLVGSHKLSLSSNRKNKFPLEKVPFLCPLEGHIFLNLQCEVGSRLEERGFLTMFEDVSGFGSWHRRWCVLSGYYISYWTYPDDEKRKNPIGRINLASCTSRAVEPANREFCARPNTMELITARPQREDDKETLVSQCTNTLCVTKNWLSADTKDERNLWMKKLNQILTDLRMWQPDACFGPQ